MTKKRPDGKKKAYVRLTSDHDALDVANKVGLMFCGMEMILNRDVVDWLHLDTFVFFCPPFFVCMPWM